MLAGHNMLTGHVYKVKYNLIGSLVVERTVIYAGKTEGCLRQFHFIEPEAGGFMLINDSGIVDLQPIKVTLQITTCDDSEPEYDEDSIKDDSDDSDDSDDDAFYGDDED